MTGWYPDRGRIAADLTKEAYFEALKKELNKMSDKFSGDIDRRGVFSII